MTIKIVPQPVQQVALASTADITIMGGAAGGGKSWVSSVNPARAVHLPGFTGVIFRRTSPQLRGAGSIWEETRDIYPHLGGRPKEASLMWVFPSGAQIQLTHLEYDHSVYNHQSKAYAYICFEELTQFSEHQFWYMRSRNRPARGCRVRPWMFGSCNPDPDSFVADLIDWWIDDEGFPIKERSGVVRNFVRDGDELIWVEDKVPGSSSLTFIPATLDDNRILDSNDPTYRDKLEGLPYVEKMRLLHGNWRVRATGSVFGRMDLRFVAPQDIPHDLQLIRAWDRASRRRKPGVDPDLTSGVLGGVRFAGTPQEELWIVDVENTQGTPADVERLIRLTAERDGPMVPIYLEEEFGASGKEATHYYRTRVLPGYEVHADRPTGSKTSRASLWVPHAESGRLMIVRSEVWNRRFVDSMRSFPSGKRDMIDAASLVYKAAMVHKWAGRGRVLSKRAQSRNITKLF